MTQAIEVTIKWNISGSTIASARSDARRTRFAQHATTERRFVAIEAAREHALALGWRGVWQGGSLPGAVARWAFVQLDIAIDVAAATAARTNWDTWFVVTDDDVAAYAARAERLRRRERKTRDEWTLRGSYDGGRTWCDLGTYGPGADGRRAGREDLKTYRENEQNARHALVCVRIPK